MWLAPAHLSRPFPSQEQLIKEEAMKYLSNRTPPLITKGKRILSAAPATWNGLVLSL